MAQQAMTTQAACGGRFMLGVGPSHHLVVESMWGLSYEKPARHVREYLEVLIPLVRDGRVQFQGEVYRTQGQIAVAGMKPLPVLISALAPMMLKIAGTLADGTITWMTGVEDGRDAHRAVDHEGGEGGGAGSAARRRGPADLRDGRCGGRRTRRRARSSRCTAGCRTTGACSTRKARRPRGKSPSSGTRREVEAKVRSVASAGATDLIAPIFPTGPNAARVDGADAGADEEPHRQGVMVPHMVLSR